MSAPLAVLKELVSGDWCWLERTLFDGKVTNEYLPCWMAEWLLENDPQNGVTIYKARVIRDEYVQGRSGFGYELQ